MKKLTIPQQYQLGITSFIKIDENLFNKLLNSLTEAYPFISLDSLVLEISPKVEEIDINDLQEILRAIRSIYSLLTEENLKKSEIVEGFSDAISNDDAFLSLSDEELSNFKHRLNKLLAIDGSITISSKARGLLQEYDHIFLKSRIVTDVRPIFKSEIKEGIAGALVVHTLKIEYQDASGLREFYVTLDSNDVQNLQSQISESLVESDVIQSMLNKANVLYLDPNFNSK
ncbi:hypothetical protein [Cylindrospermum sp. FACHB-282]|uniref:hypothetical protein n=1 Tax=Cylindrospermum sp. FACHB-282 TaxID=2692794 RepID=UPI001687DBD3|nr:hypothetical protein [Cylindrospermum sp. FACHB-282]MBD2388104.1 hypothetical protein [Cylindrospermum sp. FACHB-282]